MPDVITFRAVVQSKLSNGNRSAGAPLHWLLGFYFHQMQFAVDWIYPSTFCWLECPLDVLIWRRSFQMKKNKLLSSPYACAVLQEACVVVQMQPATECYHELR